MAYGSVAAERTRQIARRELQRRSREEGDKRSLALAQVTQPPLCPPDQPTANTHEEPHPQQDQPVSNEQTEGKLHRESRPVVDELIKWVSALQKVNDGQTKTIHKLQAENTSLQGENAQLKSQFAILSRQNMRLMFGDGGFSAAQTGSPASYQPQDKSHRHQLPRLLAPEPVHNAQSASNEAGLDRQPGSNTMLTDEQHPHPQQGTGSLQSPRHPAFRVFEASNDPSRTSPLHGGWLPDEDMDEEALLDGWNEPKVPKNPTVFEEPPFSSQVAKQGHEQYQPSQLSAPEPWKASAKVDCTINETVIQEIQDWIREANPDEFEEGQSFTAWMKSHGSTAVRDQTHNDQATSDPSTGRLYSPPIWPSFANLTSEELLRWNPDTPIESIERATPQVSVDGAASKHHYQPRCDSGGTNSDYEEFDLSNL